MTIWILCTRTRVHHRTSKGRLARVHIINLYSFAKLHVITDRVSGGKNTYTIQFIENGLKNELPYLITYTCSMDNRTFALSHRSCNLMTARVLRVIGNFGSSYKRRTSNWTERLSNKYICQRRWRRTAIGPDLGGTLLGLRYAVHVRLLIKSPSERWTFYRVSLNKFRVSTNVRFHENRSAYTSEISRNIKYFIVKRYRLLFLHYLNFYYYAYPTSKYISQ